MKHLFWWLVTIVGCLWLSCQELPAQELRKVEVYDTSTLVSFRFNPSTWEAMQYLYNVSNNRRVEDSACLYGEVQGDTLNIVGLVKMETLEGDSISVTQRGGCPDKMGQFARVAHIHTHIAFTVMARMGMSNVDNRTFWANKEHLMDFVIWNMDTEYVYLTFHFRHGEGGLWRARR